MPIVNTGYLVAEALSCNYQKTGANAGQPITWWDAGGRIGGLVATEAGLTAGLCGAMGYNPILWGGSDAAGAAATATNSAVAAESIGGRLGSASTRAQVAQIQAELDSRGWNVTKGGTLGEEYIPGPGGARAGSAYPDITAIKDGRILRINTIDTLSDGLTPTAREAAAAAKIRMLRPDDHLLLVPKAQ